MDATTDTNPGLPAQGTSSAATSTANPQQAAIAPILFFDGVCGLCNRFVDFVLRHERSPILRFAPLQGEAALELLEADDIGQLKTVVLHDGRRTFRRSPAVVRILWLMGGVWSLAGTLLWLVPLPIRDLGYRLLSTFRYRLFGKKESCRLPTPDERNRFLP